MVGRQTIERWPFDGSSLAGTAAATTAEYVSGEPHRASIDLPTAVQLAMLPRFYERIGDHAVTITEPRHFTWSPAPSTAAHGYEPRPPERFGRTASAGVPDASNSPEAQPNRDAPHRD